MNITFPGTQKERTRAIEILKGLKKKERQKYSLPLKMKSHTRIIGNYLYDDLAIEFNKAIDKAIAELRREETP